MLNNKKFHLYKKIKHQNGKNYIKIIDINDGLVKKKSFNVSNLDADILKFFCKKYNEFLPYNFKFNMIKLENINVTSFSHLFLKRSIIQYIVPKSVLFNNTKKILDEYVNDKDSLVHELKEQNKFIDRIEVDMGNDKYVPNNYFMHNWKIYLFDIENFYLKFYDSNNNLLSNKNINFKYDIVPFYSHRKRNYESCYTF